MKIAFIAVSVVPSWTANSVQVMKVCQALKQNDHDVHLIVPGKITTSWNDMRSHYGIQNEFPVHWLGFNRSLKKLDFVISALTLTKKLQLDLVYTRLLWAAVLASWMGLPVILEVHDRPVGRMGTPLFKQLLKSQGNKRIVLITHALKAILEQEYHLQFRPDETIIAPDGIDLERYSKKVDASSARDQLGLEDRFTAVYSGGFYEGRGLESLMELAIRFPEVRFLWVGGKKDVVEIWKKKLENAGVRNVYLTGFVPNEQLPLYQMAADILLMPYGKIIAGSSGGNIADVSSPMKMFEYMAAGRVILTSDIPVLREVLNETNAAFYTSEDMQSMERVFETLIQDEGMRNRLSSQALTDVEKYSWRARMQRIISSVDGKI
jgi:glycosyltransferase involved in cell wall biosynthesis